MGECFSVGERPKKIKCSAFPHILCSLERTGMHRNAPYAPCACVHPHPTPCIGYSTRLFISYCLSAAESILCCPTHHYRHVRVRHAMPTGVPCMRAGVCTLPRPRRSPRTSTCPHLPRAPCVSVEGGTRGDSGFMVSWGARASHSHSHLARGSVGRARVQGHVEPPRASPPTTSRATPTMAHPNQHCTYTLGLPRGS